MRPLNYFIKYVSYPVWMIKDQRLNLYRYLWEYRNYNSLTTDHLIQRQSEKLEKILKHAYRHTIYYKNLFHHYGISFDDLSTPEIALKDMPILSKKIISEHINDIVANNIPREHLSKDSTGGSTGIPLVFYRDKECFLKRRAQELFFDKWIGYEIGDKVAFFVAARHHPKGAKGIKYKIRNATGERLVSFNPYKIDKNYMGYFLDELRNFEPEIIKCFPNSLFIFANFLKEKGIDDIRPRAVSCTGETLHKHQRELFEEVFQCPVFEKYASFEVGVAACECSEHNGLHMFLDGVYFEFLNSDGRPAKPGEIAQLIVTDLFNFGFPLIRYQIGDIGVYSDKLCPCGSPLPLIMNLYGRDRDILVDENGNPKPGYLFVEVFNKNHIPGQFQVIQQNENNVLINIVKKGEFSSSHENLILAKFRQLLGDTISVKVNYVDNISREPSGKYKYVHSMISPFQ